MCLIFVDRFEVVLGLTAAEQLFVLIYARKGCFYIGNDITSDHLHVLWVNFSCEVNYDLPEDFSFAVSDRSSMTNDRPRAEPRPHVDKSISVFSPVLGCTL